MVQVITPLAAATPDALAEQARQAQAEGADLVELRLDLCREQGADVAACIAAIPRLPLPVVATMRHVDEGGRWDGAEDARLDLLAAADRAGAAYIDLELAHHRPGWRPARARLILSFHDFRGMGGDLAAMVDRQRAAGADVAKVAVMPRDAADLAVIEALCRRGGGPLCAIAMGEHGLPSRLLAGAWGAAFTFAHLDGGDGSAPGQPTVRELVGLYRIKRQGPRTRIFGVIGNPVGHSLSPLIHNTALAHHGIDAVYVPFLVGDALPFWAACGGWIDGLSITIPHKHALLTAVHGLEPLAERIGAMNTICRDAGNRAIGANTDASAAAACLESQLGSLQGRRITLLGAGGVSRGIAFALAERGAKLVIANRGRERAEELAKEVGAKVVDFDKATTTPYDALVNGTSQGMDDPTTSPWPASAHRAGTVVFDTVYTPLETKLVKEAQAAGARTICGISMFIGQALGQYRRWFGIDAPEGLMHRMALERLLEKEGRAASMTADRRGTAGLETSLGGGG
jgi:3-dehydroquinate dehydratase/shikimate dehydrogenase